MTAKMPDIMRATHGSPDGGGLNLGGLFIPCYVLENGTRVLSGRGMQKALKPGKSHASNPVSFLGTSAFNPFISKALAMRLSSPIKFIRPGRGGAHAIGFEAEILPQICSAILKARKVQGKLFSASNRELAEHCEIILGALAHVGIIALVDEATGYQNVRDRLALQAILDKYLRTEYAKWAKCFPDEFYQEMFRLRKWEWKGMKENRPGVVGHYTNDIVYSRLAPGVLQELKKLNPAKETGGRDAKHHQWMTEDIGIPGLSRHLHAVIAVMKISTTWPQFHRSLTKAFPRLGDHVEMDLGDE